MSDSPCNLAKKAQDVYGFGHRLLLGLPLDCRCGASIGGSASKYGMSFSHVPCEHRSIHKHALPHATTLRKTIRARDDSKRHEKEKMDLFLSELFHILKSRRQDRTFEGSAWLIFGQSDRCPRFARLYHLWQRRKTAGCVCAIGLQEGHTRHVSLGSPRFNTNAEIDSTFCKTVLL